jgi:hypothetical protein
MYLLSVADPVRVAILSGKSKGLEVRCSWGPARCVDQSLPSAQGLVDGIPKPLREQAGLRGWTRECQQMPL